MAELRTGRKKIVATIEIPKRGRGNLTAEGTPLVVLYRDFEISQKDKGNAEQTIQYYDRGFAKFCVFLANRYYYTGLMKTFNIDKETAKKATQLMRDKLGIDEDENENIKAYADGMMMPVAILMAEGLESNYRDYLRNECKVSEVTRSQVIFVLIVLLLTLLWMKNGYQEEKLWLEKRKPQLRIAIRKKNSKSC